MLVVCDMAAAHRITYAVCNALRSYMWMKWKESVPKIRKQRRTSHHIAHPLEGWVAAQFNAYTSGSILTLYVVFDFPHFYLFASLGCHRRLRCHHRCCRRLRDNNTPPWETIIRCSCVQNSTRYLGIGSIAENDTTNVILIYYLSHENHIRLPKKIYDKYSWVISNNALPLPAPPQNSRWCEMWKCMYTNKITGVVCGKLHVGLPPLCVSQQIHKYEPFAFSFQIADRRVHPQPLQTAQIALSREFAGISNRTTLMNIFGVHLIK